MLFGATPFAATTFAGVGAQNIVLSVTGNRLNVSIGNATDRIFPSQKRENLFYFRNPD